jgi:hypothetical protein
VRHKRPPVTPLFFKKEKATQTATTTGNNSPVTLAAPGSTVNNGTTTTETNVSIQNNSLVSVGGDNNGNIANLQNSPNAVINQSIVKPLTPDTKKSIRDLLEAINPKVIEAIDAGHQQIDVMIGQSHLSQLFDLKSRPDFTNFLAFEETGNVMNGTQNSQLGDFINDLTDNSVMTGCILFVHDALNNPIAENPMTGFLIPANDPTPMLPGGFPSPTNAVTLFLGNSASIVYWFPHNVIKYKGQSLLTIFNSPRGVSVSAKMFGANGSIVCMLESNQFTINPSNFLIRYMPDKSTLIVRDADNVEVLNMRYLNSTYVSLVFTRKPVIPNEINDFLQFAKIVLMKQDESQNSFTVKNC